MGTVNVLYIIDMFYGKGGAEKNLLQLVRGIDRSRYTPSILCLHHGKLLNDLRREGIEGRELRLEKVYGLRGLVEALRLFRYIKRRGIKIVVTYHESSDLFGGLVAWLAGVPVIISNRRDMGYKLKARHILMYRLINHFFDRIIVVSEAVREAVCARQKLLWHKVVTVYNGVETDIPEISDAERERIRESLGMVNRDWLVVGTTGSVRTIKGYRYLVAAAAQVIKEIPGVYFLIIGSPDDPQYLERLKKMSRELEIVSHVVFCDHKPNILPYLQLMDLCVSPSLSEGMSNAVLEYMSCSKAVVATRAGGNPEVVEHGVTGLLVPSQDAVSLARAIVGLLKDPQSRRAMGSAGKNAARCRFSIQSMLAKIESLYDNLLDQHGAGRRWFDPGSSRKIVSRSIKEALGQSMHYAGGTQLLRSLAGRGLRIVAYHRIGETWFDPFSMCLPIELFERNLAHIKKYYVPLSLDEALYLFRSGKKLPDKAVALTFDDGYVDNLINALPLLKRYEIPATVFVSVNAVEKDGAIWHDRLIEAFKVTTCSTLDLRAAGLGEYRLSGVMQRVRACRQLMGRCQGVANHLRPALIDAIVKGLTGDIKPRTRTILDWEEVRYLVSQGVAIGSHGMDHCPLSTFTPEQAEYEMRESKHLIRERAGIDPVYFANPFGNPRDIKDDTVVLLKNCGYAAAFVLWRGVNRDPAAFVFGRYCISAGMVSGLTGGYSESVFDLQMALPYGFPAHSMEEAVQPA